MKSRKLRNLEVSAIGYGSMGLSQGYGSIPDRKESIDLLHNTYDMGCTFFDTAEAYGMGSNEELLGEALTGIRNKVTIATKFWIQESIESYSTGKLMEIIKSKVENSLKRLKTDHVELYYQHRVNKDIPVEDIAYCMGELIREGKILGWGQSQATEEEIRKAHAVTPITAIQSEYSIMARQFEKDVIPTCEELGIGFVAFSPLANGFLSGQVNTETEFKGIDARRVINRFEKDNIIANQPLLELLHEFALLKEATPAQISLAWMLHKNNFIVPIPGSRNLQRIAENMGSADIILNDSEFDQIERALSTIQIYGDRRDEDIARLRTLKD
ncbi:aldehyde oxidase [Chryseobacterium sp. T16E-39]|uniref:aldo/keto reductase n=1 Tax=Chryseobacterium sp. T16E-39 TaxID=2015076 RepID=UPI000B5B23C5|nr:aldo/keto reductase [Chryseobacterium sp. T16E-39]ASK28727.1 aldehyde oxidase [Chryseobacterium sp. T16E-39]